MLSAILALFLAGGDIHNSMVVPEDFEALPIAEFRKKIRVTVSDETRAEKIAKSAKCDFHNELGWAHARVQVAIFVAANGRLEKIVPVSRGCDPLTSYVGELIRAKAADKAPIPPAGKGQWYRTAMNFRWPV